VILQKFKGTKTAVVTGR